jgi:hypothetical protein
MNTVISTEVRPEVSISTWNIDPVHGLLVGDAVTINLDVQLIKER